jgi:hypothetical protein
MEKETHIPLQPDPESNFDFGYHEQKEKYKKEKDKERNPEKYKEEEKKDDQVDLKTDPRWAARKKELGGAKPPNPTR